MVYCMADIHGEILRWKEMLQLIQFSDEDTLYILGDVIDRNPHGIEILQDIMRRPNVKMILGNHEQMMLDSFCSYDTIGCRCRWKANGGGNTYRSMVYRISAEERLEILRFIQELPDHLDIEVDGREFHLVHGMPGDNKHDRIWGRPDLPPAGHPLPDKTTIIGHTCTYYLNIFVDGYNEDGPYEIFYSPGLIDIDCGCGNETDLRRLACLRLDDMKEFYI